MESLDALYDTEMLSGAYKLFKGVVLSSTPARRGRRRIGGVGVDLQELRTICWFKG